MNTKNRLFAPIAIMVGTIGIGSMAIAGLKIHHSPSSIVTQNHDGMNHGGMTDEHKQSMMMSMSLGKADAGFDKRFLDAMIPHHQGALTMSQDSLKKSQRPELQKLSQNIIKSQQSEIDRMTQWRQAWYVEKK